MDWQFIYFHQVITTYILMESALDSTLAADAIAILLSLYMRLDMDMKLARPLIHFLYHPIADIRDRNVSYCEYNS